MKEAVAKGAASLVAVTVSTHAARVRQRKDTVNLIRYNSGQTL